MKIVRNLLIIFGRLTLIDVYFLINFFSIEFVVQNFNHLYYPMENIMNLFDRILNELIVNVLYVQQPVIKLVLLVYSIILTIFVLIKTTFILYWVFFLSLPSAFFLRLTHDW
jgi:hypothetical protein